MYWRCTRFCVSKPHLTYLTDSSFVVRHVAGSTQWTLLLRLAPAITEAMTNTSQDQFTGYYKPHHCTVVAGIYIPSSQISIYAITAIWFLCIQPLFPRSCNSCLSLSTSTYTTSCSESTTLSVPQWMLLTLCHTHTVDASYTMYAKPNCVQT